MDTSKKKGGPSGQKKNIKFNTTVLGVGCVRANWSDIGGFSVWHGALAGYYYNNSLDHHGTNGFWWSRTVRDGDYTYGMDQASSSFNLEGTNTKRIGRSVRCIYAPSNGCSGPNFNGVMLALFLRV